MARFVLNGLPMFLDAEDVTARLRDVAPEAVREHGVRVGGVVYPVKQAFEVASGVSRADFTSQTARRHLQALGFELIGTANAPSSSVTVSIDAVAGVSATAGHDPLGWPWEGRVQALFGAYLQRHGWLITSMADTATKARGVDIIAGKGPRRLGAEVKGWPSDSYADPRRAAQVKNTQPSTQAGHWFSQALLKAVMLLDSHPGYESLMVLPDYPRYRDLAHRTRTGREAAGIHVALIDSDGHVTAETWTP